MGAAVILGRRRYRSGHRLSLEVKVELSKRTVMEGILWGLRSFADFGVKFTLTFLVVAALMKADIDEEIVLILRPLLAQTGQCR